MGCGGEMRSAVRRDWGRNGEERKRKGEKEECRVSVMGFDGKAENGEIGEAKAWCPVGGCNRIVAATQQMSIW